MTPNPRRIRERLQADVYAKIPSVACKMLCQASCTVIPCSAAEASAVQRAGGERLYPRDDLSCSMLDSDGSCRVYNDRPTICRLYGAVEGMLCPHGCVPERILSRPEAMELLRKADEIGGVNKSERMVQMELLARLDATGLTNDSR